ncbi:MAG: putative rane protein [Moraxellaceae bacterium]|jgi:uncharacterized membrane protein|nr:putative rane protein [Moraxellaceae bacterium]
MTVEEKARHGRTAATVFLGLLLAALLLQTLLQPLPAAAMAFMVAVKLLPLSIFLPLLWRGRTQSVLWFSMFLMPYFCWAILGAFVPGTEGLVAMLVALLIAACFSASMLLIRWQRAAGLTQNP